MNFNPDFGDDDIFEPDEVKQEPEKLTVYRPEQEVSIIDDINKNEVMSMSNLTKITLSHMEDIQKSREAVAIITDMMNDLIPQMSVKELNEYLKTKIRECEYHTDCIFKAYAIVQKSDIAKEMFAGSDRKERVLKAIDRTNITKWIGLLNTHANTDSDYDGG